MKNKINNKDILVIVLGAARSGTSLITKSIESLGFRLSSNLWPADKINPKGFFEDKDFVLFNSKLLDDDDIFIEHGIINQQRLNFFYSKYEKEAKELVLKKIKKERVSLIKDPRLMSLLPFYKIIFNELKIKVAYVICIRHPSAVAQSRQSAGGTDIISSYYLWYFSYINILIELKNYKKIVIDYESFLSNPEKHLIKLSSYLKVGFNRNDHKISSFLQSFIDKKMIHFLAKKDSNVFYKNASYLYSVLKRNSLSNDLYLNVEASIKHLIKQHQHDNKIHLPFFIELKKKRTMLSDLYRSRSWRFTYPLRFISQIFKNIP